MFRSELKNRLETLKEKYQGKSAIIFGNGPSVSNINIKLIKENKNIITLTTNQIAPICKKNDWYPDLYTAFFCEPLRGKKYKKFLRKPINYQGSYKKALLAQKDVKYMVENKYTECFINDWFEKFANCLNMLLIFCDAGRRVFSFRMFNRSFSQVTIPAASCPRC